MATINSGDWPINSTTTTGDDLAVKLNRFVAAIMSGDSSTSQPPGIAAGHVWTQTSGTNFLIRLFTGSAHVTLTTVASDGTVTPAGTYTSAAIDTKLTNLESSILSKTVQTVTAGGGISVTGTTIAKTIAHADTSATTSITNTNGTVIQSLGFDTYGHVTSRTTVNLDSRYYTQASADARYLLNTTDSMSGALVIGGNLTVNGGTTVLGDWVNSSGTSGFHFRPTSSSSWVFRMDTDGGLGNAISVVRRDYGDARYGLRTPGDGDIGSYALLRRTTGGITKPGAIVAGTDLAYSTADGRTTHAGFVDAAIRPPGKWQCMGLSSSYDGTNDGSDNTTLWMRTE